MNTHFLMLVVGGALAGAIVTGAVMTGAAAGKATPYARQMLDLIFTVGNYHLNAMDTNSVGMPMGEGYGRMPKG